MLEEWNSYKDKKIKWQEYGKMTRREKINKIKENKVMERRKKERKIVRNVKKKYNTEESREEKREASL